MKFSSKPTSEIFPGSSLMTNLIPLLPPQAPSFSSFLISTTPATLPSAKDETRGGLFEALVGDPNVMLSDYLDHPEKYEAGVYDLLLDLTGGRRRYTDLTPDEKRLLEHAVLDFNETNKKPPEPPPPPPPEEPPKEKEIEYHEKVVAPFRGEVPYWWT